jgi:hypothetical protein
VNDAPCGSMRLAKRPIGMSVGSIAIVAPSSRALPRSRLHPRPRSKRSSARERPAGSTPRSPAWGAGGAVANSRGAKRAAPRRMPSGAIPETTVGSSHEMPSDMFASSHTRTPAARGAQMKVLRALAASARPFLSAFQLIETTRSRAGRSGPASLRLLEQSPL